MLFEVEPSCKLQHLSYLWAPFFIVSKAAGFSNCRMDTGNNTINYFTQFSKHFWKVYPISVFLILVFGSVIDSQRRYMELSPCNAEPHIISLLLVIASFSSHLRTILTTGYFFPIGQLSLGLQKLYQAWSEIYFSEPETSEIEMKIRKRAWLIMFAIVSCTLNTGTGKIMFLQSALPLPNMMYSYFFNSSL